MFDRLLVVELASVLAGPSVGQFLAELGARVIKVERPGSGDVTRSWHRAGENPGETASYFFACNFGKESLALDLTDPAGLGAVRELVGQADVLISSFAPGSAEKLGLGPDTLRALNARLIHARVSGYGPNSDRPGYDAVIQAESGFMALNGHATGPPTKMPVALVDVLAAHHLKEAILVALIERVATGQGKDVEVSLFDAAVASLANQATGCLAGGTEPGRMGSAHPNIAPYGTVLCTSDGMNILLAAGTDRQFAALCEALGAPELATEPEFATNADRVRRRDTLEPRLQEAAGRMAGTALLHVLRQTRVPAGVIQPVSKALSAAPGVLLPNEGGTPGLRQWLGAPSGSRRSLSAPPELGAHTASILAEISSLSESERIRLINHTRNA